MKTEKNKTINNEKKVDKEGKRKRIVILKENNVRMEKISFLCPEWLECQVCEEQYEAKVEIENYVRIFMKLKFTKNVIIVRKS